ncbi:MAG: aldo/keto reductase [Oscillatoria sp. PMC 1051.18]|nr:aldo/keto reductase [Oscillatoria sp. PMC 1050.18]MEC5028978.1 aldo/keto reductase [Oscillatoria sp. PMC 1051.18]
MNAESSVISEPLIVGCWQLDNRSWKYLSETEVERTLDTYLAWGVTHFDTADIYGRSEQLLGRLLKGRDCTILTKAVLFGNIPTANQVRSKIENSLRNLQRETLDLVQIHWQNPQLDFTSTLEIFAQLVEQGKIRQLGVTNFNTPMLKKAIQFAPITTNQVQYSLIDRRVENSMQSLCLEKEIMLLTYGPLVGGFLADKFRGVKSPPPENEHARGFYYSSVIMRHGGWSPVQEILNALAQVARKYELTIAQVALNWVKNQPGVGAVISGLTLERGQIQSNIEALQANIDSADLQFLSEKSADLFKHEGDIYSYERG